MQEGFAVIASPWRDALARLDDDLLPDLSNLRDLLAVIPLPVWAQVSYEPHAFLARAQAFLPRLPDAELVRTTSGLTTSDVRDRSIDIARWVLAAYDSGPLLEVGSGWGQLSRLLLHGVPIDSFLARALNGRLAECLSATALEPRCRVVASLHEDLPADQAVVVVASSFLSADRDTFDRLLTAVTGAVARGGSLLIRTRMPEYWLASGAAGRAAQTLETGFLSHGDETAVTGAFMNAELAARGFDVSLDWWSGEPGVVAWHGRRR